MIKGIILAIEQQPCQKGIVDYKENKNKNIKKYIVSEKNNPLKLQNPIHFQIATQKRNLIQNVKFQQIARSYILNGFWK